MTLVSKDVSILTQQVNVISSPRSILTTNQRVWNDRSVLTVTNSKISKAVSILTKSNSAAYITALSSRRKTFGVEILIKNLTTGSSKTIPWRDVVLLTFSKHRNEPFTWNLTLDNRTRNYSPYNTGSAYYGWLAPDIWNPSGLIERVWQLRIVTGGRTWESPYLTLDDFSCSGAAGGYEANFSGIDLTEYLLRENQTMASFVSSPGSIKMAKQTVIDILNNFKVTKNNVDFTDYPLWKVHFQGERPLDILTRIFNIPRCKWYWKADTFYVRDPGFKPNGPADWEYAAGDNLILVDYKRSKRGLINVAEARRTLESVYTGVDQEGNDVGAKEITFSQPLWNVSMQRDCKFCYIDYVYWHNANGETGTDPGPLEPVNKVTFIVWPWASVPSGSQYYWHVIVRGMENYSDQVLGSTLFDKTFHVRSTNETSVNAYGRRPMREPEEDPLIPNAAWAKTITERILDESGRLVETINFDCPLNPFMEPDDTVKITEPHAGLNHYFLIENVDVSLSGNDVSQNFGVTKYIA